LWEDGVRARTLQKILVTANFFRKILVILLSARAALRLISCKGRMRSRRKKTMSRRAIHFAVTVLAALALVIPAAARENGPNKSKSTAHGTFVLVDTATLGGKQLKPGTYDVKADDNKVTLMRDGKIVAEAPVQWKDESKKSQYSAVVTDGDGNQIRSVHFNGMTKYAEISETTTANGQQ
jgi:hypothetical protein